ncbi:MAG: hypothetical protein ACXABY_37655 [Candidatus Thorarchaeota archaeon]|jgi:hypothetical protein
MGWGYCKRCERTREERRDAIRDLDEANKKMEVLRKEVKALRLARRTDNNIIRAEEVLPGDTFDGEVIVAVTIKDYYYGSTTVYVYPKNRKKVREFTAGTLILIGDILD